MPKGHTIPLLHLSHLLLQRRLVCHITFFTTSQNAQFFQSFLSINTLDQDISIVMLPFPENLPQSIDLLTSISQFISFVKSFKILQPHLEKSIHSLPLPVDFIISDPFYTWISESAKRINIPLVSFDGMGCFSHTIKSIIQTQKPNKHLKNEDLSPFSMPNFTHIELTMADLPDSLNTANPSGPMHEFDKEIVKAISESDGIIFNSFYELEERYCDYWDACIGPKSWCVGPFCLARPNHYETDQPAWIKWLDSKLETQTPVLYISFGTLVAVSKSQINELAAALENSNVNFLWAMKEKELDMRVNFSEKLNQNGMIVKEWVDQLQILKHKSVKGFMSHCGWNSITEGISCGVPFIAWPMMAEQHMNSKLIVDELKIGIRVRAHDGTRDGLVVREDIEMAIEELIKDGEKRRGISKNVKRLMDQARGAIMEEGSSWKSLELMTSKFSSKKGCGVTLNRK
ncbi:hypothetical protein LUZ60_000170 [Juncus effusus]|nr:hypothetical protein LUZ60_000170 [Juncus effusus]